MSCLYKGQVVESELSANARGGTEMMRDRLLNNADPELLKQVAVHLSRPRELYEDVPEPEIKVVCEKHPDTYKKQCPSCRGAING